MGRITLKIYAHRNFGSKFWGYSPYNLEPKSVLLIWEFCDFVVCSIANKFRTQQYIVNRNTTVIFHATRCAL